eukprot:9106345-Pyramimonas_sp.AAC.1
MIHCSSKRHLIQSQPQGHLLRVMPTHMMSQDAKGISTSINEETLAFTIQSLVNNTLKTWHRRNTSFGADPTSAEKDFALRNLQAKVDQAIHEKGAKWTLPDAQAGAPAEGDDAAE